VGVIVSYFSVSRLSFKFFYEQCLETILKRWDCPRNIELWIFSKSKNENEPIKCNIFSSSHTFLKLNYYTLYLSHFLHGKLWLNIVRLILWITVVAFYMYAKNVWWHIVRRAIILCMYKYFKSVLNNFF